MCKWATSGDKCSVASSLKLFIVLSRVATTKPKASTIKQVIAHHFGQLSFRLVVNQSRPFEQIIYTQEAMESFAFPDEFMMKLTKIWTFFKTNRQSIFLVKIEELLVKNNHFNTKLWITFRSPRNARLNQGTCYSQGKVSSFQGMCLLSYLNGWCGSYLRTTKGCQTRYLKSSGS